MSSLLLAQVPDVSQIPGVAVGKAFSSHQILDEALILPLYPKSRGELESSDRQMRQGKPERGLAELDELLPDGGLPRGQVVELSAVKGLGLGTSLGLIACRAAQDTARANGSSAWCSFVDPSGTLHAPGVSQAGVDLSRLLVVRPSIASLERVVLRLAEAKAFSVIVVDTVGTAWGVSPGQPDQVSLKNWGRIVRRLALAIEKTSTLILLVTDSEQHRSLPLPVALRLELQRKQLGQLSVRVAKEKRGRISAERVISWGSFNETIGSKVPVVRRARGNHASSSSVCPPGMIISGAVAEPQKLRTDPVESERAKKASKMSVSGLTGHGARASTLGKSGSVSSTTSGTAPLESKRELRAERPLAPRIDEQKNRELHRAVIESLGNRSTRGRLTQSTRASL